MKLYDYGNKIDPSCLNQFFSSATQSIMDFILLPFRALFGNSEAIETILAMQKWLEMIQLHIILALVSIAFISAVMLLIARRRNYLYFNSVSEKKRS